MVFCSLILVKTKKKLNQPLQEALLHLAEDSGPPHRPLGHSLFDPVEQCSLRDLEFSSCFFKQRPVLLHLLYCLLKNTHCSASCSEPVRFKHPVKLLLSCCWGTQLLLLELSAIGCARRRQGKMLSFKNIDLHKETLRQVLILLRPRTSYHPPLTHYTYTHTEGMRGILSAFDITLLLFWYIISNDLFFSVW